jgi:poly(3-hydroxyalkanoate) depolymerase
MSISDRRLSTFVRVDGSLLRVSVRGGGVPLLLIMGLGGNIEMWRPLEDVLVARGIQTIAYDASGTGESPPRLLPRRMPGMARQAAHLLDALGVPAVSVLGVSAGGAVAQELALANPHRVDRLILASTMCGLGGVPGNPLALSVLATPVRYYSPTFFRLTVKMAYGSESAKTVQEQIRARRARPPTVRGYMGQLAATMGWTSLPWLHRLACPTLVLSGDSDPIVPAVNARILAARIPDVRLHIVEGGGHLVLADRAEHCGEVIADFLSVEPAALDAS